VKKLWKRFVAWCKVEHVMDFKRPPGSPYYKEPKEGQ
jgi:hypothetical protein